MGGSSGMGGSDSYGVCSFTGSQCCTDMCSSLNSLVTPAVAWAATLMVYVQ